MNSKKLKELVHKFSFWIKFILILDAKSACVQIWYTALQIDLKYPWLLQNHNIW